VDNQTPSPNADLVIGVDGGGTKTVAWVAPLDDPTNAVVLGRGTSGPGNPRAAGFESAQRHIAEAVASALAEAGRSPAPVCAACFGLSGAGRESEQTRIATWAMEQAGIALQVRVTGDAEPILATASADHWGIALIGGTGSLAWGRNREGVVARSGGWGYLIGDEGSAYSLAVAALRAAMQSSDGRRPPTRMLDALQQHLGVDSPSALIECVYDEQMTRDRLAGCAQAVFSVADDPAAAALIARAADDLASMVAALARQLQLPPRGYPLAIAGSLLLNQASLRQQMLDQLAAANAGPAEVVLVTEPVRGAVALARRIHG
jgi:N-acetylglucosamine kinase-like BadF-type ATPase